MPTAVPQCKRWNGIYVDVQRAHQGRGERTGRQSLLLSRVLLPRIGRDGAGDSPVHTTPSVSMGSCNPSRRCLLQKPSSTVLGLRVPGAALYLMGKPFQCWGCLDCEVALTTHGVGRRQPAHAERGLLIPCALTGSRSMLFLLPDGQARCCTHLPYSSYQQNIWRCVVCWVCCPYRLPLFCPW